MHLKGNAMANIPGWLKCHPFLSSKKSRLDWQSWLVGADRHEDESEYALANDVRWRGQLFEAIVKAVESAALYNGMDCIRPFKSSGWIGAATAFTAIILLRVRHVPSGKIVQYNLSRRLMLQNPEYLPNRIVNEILR